MKEIEYRAKRKDNNEWVYGNLIIDEDRYYICLQVNDHIKRDDYEVYMVEVIPATVGQYTGLKDKKGVKIYEGDIFEVINSYEEKFIVYVEYNEKYAEFVIKCNDNIVIDNEPLGDINTEETVIILDNIHDNPELL